MTSKLKKHLIAASLSWGFIFLFAIAFAAHVVAAPEDDAFERPPGTIIATSPDFQTVYVGSPSIAVMPDGTYVASHDWFGTGIRPTRVVVYLSKDQGKTWKKQSELLHQHWSNLFVHNGALYILGTLKGNWVIRRSDDGGLTWTEPKDSKSGLLLEGRYHTAPCPMLIHNGRIWRAFEKMEKPYEWGTCFRAMMSSAPVEADLLDAGSWTFSNELPYPFDQWPGRGWLEGNAVLSPEGKVVNVIRVQIEGGDKAAIINCSDDGKNLSFDPKTSMIDFPGGAVKFTIRYDKTSEKYWSIVSKQKDPPATRNFLVLTSSKDLRDWNVETILFRHRDRIQHAWQYIDWIFEGDDNIVYVSRTGWDGSHNQHDANYLTFHRLEDFRKLDRKDDTPWIGRETTLKMETKKLSISYYGKPNHKIHLETFSNDKKTFANRRYVWKNVPKELDGWTSVMNYGGEQTGLVATAKEDVEIAFVRSHTIHGLHLPDWTAVKTEKLHYTDDKNTEMTVYRKTLRKGETVSLPHLTGWTGETLLFKE